MQMVIEIAKKYSNFTESMFSDFVGELSKMANDPECTAVVLDFKGITIINSMTIGAIFASYQSLRNKGKYMVIINTSDKVTRLMRLINLDSLMHLY